MGETTAVLTNREGRRGLQRAEREVAPTEDRILLDNIVWRN